MMLLLLLLLQSTTVQAQWLHTNGPNGGLVQALTFSGTELFTGTYGGGVFRSSGNGPSWIPVNSGLTKKEVIAIAAKGAVIAVGTSNIGVFVPSERQVDGWQASNPDLTNQKITALAISDRNDIFAATDGGGIFKSLDRSVSWSALNDGLRFVGITAVRVVDTVLLASNHNGIYIFHPEFQGWPESGITGNPHLTQCLMVNGARVYAGTDDRVWRRRLSEMISKVTHYATLDQHEITLSQNFPNPFNPVTTICFSLPRATTVSLIIYNALGEKIADLIECKMAAGTHQAVWNAAAFCGGDYCCRIKAGNFTATGKLVLLPPHLCRIQPGVNSHKSHVLAEDKNENEKKNRDFYGGISPVYYCLLGWPDHYSITTDTRPENC